MTAHELLMTCRQAGIVLTPVGQSIEVDAPADALTPDLHAELVRLKPVLLPMLTPTVDDQEMFPLRNGVAVPWPAAQLALALEDRGFTMGLDEQGQFTIEPMPDLTDADREAIERWRSELAVILAYDADACGFREDERNVDDER